MGQRAWLRRQGGDAGRRQRRFYTRDRPRARPHQGRHGDAFAALFDAGRRRRRQSAARRATGPVRRLQRRGDAEGIVIARMRYWLLAALIAVSASMPPAGAQQPPTPWLSLPRPADSGKAIIYDPQLAAKADQEALSG